MNATGRLKKAVEPISMLKGIIRDQNADKPKLSREEQASELALLRDEIDG